MQILILSQIHPDIWVKLRINHKISLVDPLRLIFQNQINALPDIAKHQD